MIDFRLDRGSIESHYDSNGFLHVTGYAAKTGILTYRNPDGTTRRELVNHDTLFNSDSLKSIIGVPVTNNHPPELVTPANYSKYNSGSITASRRSDNSLAVDLSINNADAIESIKSGKKELSCGYAVKLDHTPGVYQGSHYDAIQTERIYNHLAIVNSGRAGSECRLNLDAAEQVEEPKEIKTMAEIKLPSGLSVNVDDASIAAAIQGEFNSMQVKLDSTTETIEGQKTEISTLNANIDAKDEALKSRNDSDEITPTIALIDKCKRLDSKFDHLENGALKSNDAMKSSALAAMNINVDGKDSAYIQARFDIALEDTDKEKLEKQRSAGVNTDSSTEIVLTGRDKFMAAQRKGVNA